MVPRQGLAWPGSEWPLHILVPIITLRRPEQRQGPPPPFLLRPLAAAQPLLTSLSSSMAAFPRLGWVAAGGGINRSVKATDVEIRTSFQFLQFHPLRPKGLNSGHTHNSNTPESNGSPTFTVIFSAGVRNCSESLSGSRDLGRPRLCHLHGKTHNFSGLWFAQLQTRK